MVIFVSFVIPQNFAEICQAGLFLATHRKFIIGSIKVKKEITRRLHKSCTFYKQGKAGVNQCRSAITYRQN